jgi:photosystem II stability/assembly factor-like uncharacterized protein
MSRDIAAGCADYGVGSGRKLSRRVTLSAMLVALLWTLLGGVTPALGAPPHASYDAYLTSVGFADANNGWVCGHTRGSTGSYFYHTTNGGKSWRQSYLEDSAAFIAPGDGTHAWIVSAKDRVYTTRDSGDTWSLSWQPNSPMARHWAACASVDATNAWLVGGQTVLRTSDGGASWQATEVPDASDLVAVSFANALEGWAVSTSTIWQTTDGGANWHVAYTDPTAGFAGIGCWGTDVAFATGVNGRMLKTENAGVTWFNPSKWDLSPCTIRMPDFVDSKTIWILADEPPYHLVQQSTDGGQTWAGSMLALDDPITGITCIGSNDVWLVGDMGHLLHSGSDGNSWSPVDLPKTSVSIRRSPSASQVTTVRRNGVARFKLSAHVLDKWGVVWANVQLQSSSNGRTWHNVGGVVSVKAQALATRSFAVKRRGKTYYRWVVPSSAKSKKAVTPAQLVRVR